MGKIDNELSSKLLQAIVSKNYTEVRNIFEEYPNIDIADSVNDMDHDDDTNIKLLVFIFKIVKPSYSSEFFSELDTDLQEKIINLLTNEQISTLVEESSNDELADFLEEWPANVVAKVLRNTSADQRNIVNKLLGYKDDTAGSIMTTEFITLLETNTVKDALDTIRKIGKNAETIYTLFVRNNKFDLVGVLDLDDLIFQSCLE